MKTKTQLSNELQIIHQGEVNPTAAKATVGRIITEMAAGQPLQCQQHSSSIESIFVFIANGLCATLHIQAFNPKSIRKRGNNALKAPCTNNLK